MTNRTSEPDEAIASAQDSIIDSVTHGQQEAIETLESAGHAMFEGMNRVQHEIADFITERIRQDMETQQQFLRCRTLDDVRRVQTDFFKTAMDQYASEATRLLKLGSEVAAMSMERGRH
jgi:hypothetical protein